MEEQELFVLAQEYIRKADAALDEYNFDKRINYLKKACEVLENHANRQAYAIQLNAIGVAYSDVGDSSMAMEYILQSLDVANDNNLLVSKVINYHCIASMYLELEFYTKALSYYNVAGEFLEQAKKESSEDVAFGQFMLYYFRAFCYEKLDELDLAKEQLQLAEDIFLAQPKKNVYQNAELSILALKCTIAYRNENYKFINMNMRRLVDLTRELKITPGFNRSIKMIAQLFKNMDNDYCWRLVLNFMDEVSQKQKGPLSLASKEMWMDYYKTVGNKDLYTVLCVEYMENLEDYRVATRNLRASAIETKIDLRNARELTKQAENKTKTDELTGVGSRYALRTDAGALINKAIKNNTKLAVGMIDVDYFKEVNDTYGHAKGDEVLRGIASIIKDSLNKHGRLYRYGGDEFVIIVTRTCLKDIKELCIKIKVAVEDAGYINSGSKASDIVTVSQGFTVFDISKKVEIESLLKFPDELMYQVKTNGRNDFIVSAERVKDK